jgi:L-lactate dehydrogenase (cytochrome)
VFDYVEGAAERELSKDRAVDAFAQVVFSPHVVRDVSSV